MLVQRYFNDKIYAIEVDEVIHKKNFVTESGLIELALVKPFNNLSEYNIVEVSTGKAIVTHVGRLSEISFINICTLFCKLGHKKIKSQINKNKKIEEFPIRKKE